MYEAFYGLREKPFNLTPDPKYLYLSEKHKEAFAHLLYGVKHRSGFVMVTGEIGTGKTTICRNLLNQLEDDVQVAFIFNPFLNPVELLKKINQEFGVDSAPNTSLELTEILNRHLLNAASQGKNCILVIDEAQNLESKVLEQIRLLSNLETETQKLLQIILIGQPELTEKLALHELRQLNQRITARYHLRALDEKETLQYIAYRLHVAGGRKKVQFTRRAIRAVYKRAVGVPRLINALCDRALLIGYTREARTITPAIIRQAAREIRGEQTYKKFQAGRWSQWLPSPAVIAAIVLVVVLVRFVAPPLERLGREFSAFNALLKGETPAAEDDRGSALVARPVDAAGTPLPPLTARVLDRLGVDQAHPDDTEAFAAFLQEADPADAATAAFAALAQAWGRDQAPAVDLDNPAAVRYAATALGLDVERLTPAFSQALELNLPLLLALRDGDQKRWIALVAQKGDRLEVAVSGRSFELPPSALRERFATEAYVLWSDPTPRAPALAPGRGDTHVAELKNRLRALGHIAPANTGNTYDAETANAVSRIQAQTGLLVDGIAGRQVRMVMAGWFGGDDVPALRPRAQVEAATTLASLPPAPARQATAPAPVPAPAANDALPDLAADTGPETIADTPGPKIEAGLPDPFGPARLLNFHVSDLPPPSEAPVPPRAIVQE